MKDSSVSEHTRESFKTSPLIMETSLSIAVKCDLVSGFSNIRNLIHKLQSVWSSHLKPNPLETLFPVTKKKNSHLD